MGTIDTHWHGHVDLSRTSIDTYELTVTEPGDDYASVTLAIEDVARLAQLASDFLGPD